MSGLLMGSRWRMKMLPLVELNDWFTFLIIPTAAGTFVSG
jgi:hypothetical protein